MICSAGDLLLTISGQGTGLWKSIRGILLRDSSDVCGEIIRDVFLFNTGPRLYLPTCANLPVSCCKQRKMHLSFCNPP